jgi:uncharacterized protein
MLPGPASALLPGPLRVQGSNLKYGEADAKHRGPMEDIKIYELKRVDLHGSTVIDGFPSVGLVSTITANYLISTLGLEQIGILDSVHFPTVSVVRNSEPLNPVRIYASRPPQNKDESQIVVFISEFQPPSNLIKIIASTILDWMQEQGCSLLVSPEGLVIDRDEEESGDQPESGANEDDGRPASPPERPEGSSVEAYGIGSTPSARGLLEKNGIKMFNEGVISGVAGVLLNEGKRRGFNVISLLAEARPNFPDARAAAKVIESIAKLLPGFKVDVGPLYLEAENIEDRIKAMQKQAKPQGKVPSSGSPSMYG